MTSLNFHQVGLVNGHQQEVCGLAWSPDGRTLASGGNDNVLNLWSAVAGGCHSEATPQFSLAEHCAAVKAVAWCPWQSSTLATGGGTADRLETDKTLFIGQWPGEDTNT